LHFTRPGIDNLHISPFFATCCTTISPLPYHFSTCISPVLATYCAIISPLLYHFSTCISPDLTFTTSIFHQQLQIQPLTFHQSLQHTVPQIHHSFTISALACHQTWHWQPPRFTSPCNLLCHHFTTPLPLQHLHFTSNYKYNLNISPVLAIYCTTISPLPYHFSSYISPDLAFTAYISLYLATCCATISPLPWNFSTCILPAITNTTLNISPVLAIYCTIISPLPYHFSSYISPDLAFTTSIFHHFLQPAVPPFHHSLATTTALGQARNCLGAAADRFFGGVGNLALLASLLPPDLIYCLQINDQASSVPDLVGGYAASLAVNWGLQ
jgi:hypothetical protein